MKFFRRLFSRSSGPSAPEPGLPPEERLDQAVLALREKLRKFLVTRSRDTGVLKKSEKWTLTKTNSSLFRLESGSLSVVINTAPFLARSTEGERITGLLRMSEVDLCRVLQGDEPLESFFRQAEGLPAGSRSILEELFGAQAVPGSEVNPSVNEIARWSDFDVFQMVARSSLNTLAHVFVHCDGPTGVQLRKNTSSRNKELIATELESLALAGSRPELNPHSKVRSLLDFEAALDEFRAQMKSYHAELLRKNQRIQALKTH